jgi:hypothetical protein
VQAPVKKFDEVSEQEIKLEVKELTLDREIIVFLEKLRDTEYISNPEKESETREILSKIRTMHGESRYLLKSEISRENILFNIKALFPRYELLLKNKPNLKYEIDHVHRNFLLIQEKHREIARTDDDFILKFNRLMLNFKTKRIPSQQYIVILNELIEDKKRETYAIELMMQKLKENEDIIDSQFNFKIP